MAAQRIAPFHPHYDDGGLLASHGRRPVSVALRLPKSSVTVDSGRPSGRGTNRGIMRKPEPSMAELRAQLSAALANYRGPVTHCAPAPPPDPDREVVDLDEQDEVDEQIVPGTVTAPAP